MMPRRKEKTMTNFELIYDTAERIFNNEETAPINPEVRYSSEQGWKLESGLYDSEWAEVTCPLEDFNQYFGGEYDTDYTPSAQDENDFLEMLRAEARSGAF